MKKILILSAVLAIAVQSRAITVDFSGVLVPADITDSTYTLGDVQFSYASGSEPGTVSGLAFVNSSGVTGSTQYGPLTIGFGQESDHLNFDFSLRPATADLADGLFASLTFKNNSGVFTDVLIPAIYDSGTGTAKGALNYAGQSFDLVQMYFSPGLYDVDGNLITPTETFTLNNLSYQPGTGSNTSVPDATSTASMLALGLVCVGGYRFGHRKH